MTPLTKNTETGCYEAELRGRHIIVPIAEFDAVLASATARRVKEQGEDPGPAGDACYFHFIAAEQWDSPTYYGSTRETTEGRLEQMAKYSYLLYQGAERGSIRETCAIQLYTAINGTLAAYLQAQATETLCSHLIDLQVGVAEASTEIAQSLLAIAQAVSLGEENNESHTPTTDAQS